MRRLQVQQLRKSYGELRAVDGISFEVEAGRVFGLLGPNGAGKSATTVILSGVLDAQGGIDAVRRRTVVDLTDRGPTHNGVIPQDLAVDLNRTARENLSFSGALPGLTAMELKDRIDWVLVGNGASAIPRKQLRF